ncbi:MAG: DUF2786 domain-containing protein [Bacteroides sp.]
MATNIKDKIAKLLSLAQSPEEHEAKAALLKARELMVEHKLRPEDIEPAENKKLMHQLIGVACTKRKGAWKITLSATMAEAYCCKAFSSREHGMGTYHIGLIGLEDDFIICERVFKYAVDCVESIAKTILLAHREIYTPQYIEKLVNAYAYGFERGIKREFKRQKEKNQEWGLVLVTPKEVQEDFDLLGEAKPFKEIDLAGLDKLNYAAAGERDGREFDIGTRLAEGAANERSHQL